MALDEQQLRAKIASILGPRAHFVVLFGSHARGRANAESDVDLAYLPRDSSIDAFFQDRAVLADAFPDVDIDLLDLRRGDPIIARQVLATGVLLHVADRMQWQEFRLRALREYDDLKIERAAAERRLLSAAHAR